MNNFSKVCPLWGNRRSEREKLVRYKKNYYKEFTIYVKVDKITNTYIPDIEKSYISLIS